MGMGECLATTGPVGDSWLVDEDLPLVIPLHFFVSEEQERVRKRECSGIIFCIPGIACQWLQSELSGYHFRVSKGYENPRHES